MSVPKYTALADEEILAKGSYLLSYEELAKEYALLREHHIAETAALAAKDRVLLAQLAATLMSGSLASMSSPVSSFLDPQKLAADMIRGAVHMAKLLLAEVDKK